MESYDFLGMGAAVRRAHPQPGVDLTYIKQTGESNGDAGDQYTGLDRFGRVKDQRWLRTSGGTHADRFQYGYDRDSNRTYRDNLVNTAFGEVYAYDGLNQVTSFQRGTLNANKDGVTGTPARSQAWDYDAVGNWDSVTTDGSAQARTHNRQNEITSGGPGSVTYDANGNVKLAPSTSSTYYTYDAWNRVARVEHIIHGTLAAFVYDGLGRRVKETRSGTTTDLYYSAAWQVLEERVSGTVKIQYVWSPEYIDALVLRDRDADGNSGNGLEERLWAVQDANFNVTALVDGSGNVVERYAYDPFGAVTVYDASWAVRAGGSSYAWLYRFQGLRYDTTTGWYHARHREYNPGHGRWVQMDPIRFSAGDVNLYRSLHNSPTSYLDPLGLQEICPKGCEPFVEAVIFAAKRYQELQNAQLVQSVIMVGAAGIIGGNYARVDQLWKRYQRRSWQLEPYGDPRRDQIMAWVRDQLTDKFWAVQNAAFVNGLAHGLASVFLATINPSLI